VYLDPVDNMLKSQKKKNLLCKIEENQISFYTTPKGEIKISVIFKAESF